MYKHYYNDPDPNNSYIASCYGTVLTSVETGGISRRILIHLPEGRRECGPVVYVFPPNGWTCESAFAEGCWKRLADEEERKEKFTVVFLEPKDGVWELDKEYGDPEDACAYLGAAMDLLNHREYVHTDISRYYVVGYGEGGTSAQIAVMGLPARVSGLVSVGAATLPEAYIQKASNAICSFLCDYETRVWHKRFLNKDVPIPVWIIDDPEYCAEDSSRMLDYWREVCGADAKTVKVAIDTDAYLRSQPAPHPANQEREAYRAWHSVLPGVTVKLGGTYNRRFWRSFLSQVNRYGGDPEGDLRIRREPIDDTNYHYQMVDGWMREWYTYVPRCVKAEPDKKVPLVIAIHGYGCSGDYYYNNTQWFKVAEECGFILVCPSGTNGGRYTPPNGARAIMAPSWNQIAAPGLPDEVVFFRELVEITSREHAIDRSRVYATGHSNGSTTSHLIGLALPDVFTAVAPCSGVIPGIFMCILDRDDVKRRPDFNMPVWMFVGRDEPELLPAQPEDGNITADSIQLWRRMNHYENEKPADWTTGWRVNGIYREIDYIKDGMPLVRYTDVGDMPHAVTPDMSFRSWDEFFSKYSRRPDGTLVYRDGVDR